MPPLGLKQWGMMVSITGNADTGEKSLKYKSSFQRICHVKASIWKDCCSELKKEFNTGDNLNVT